MSNLRIDPDYFNLLNKSLGSHDASFMHKDDTCSVKSGSSVNGGSRYNSLKKKDKFDVNKLNKDYSVKYQLGNKSLGSSDYDLNNNFRYSNAVKAGGDGGDDCATGSESDFELPNPYRYLASNAKVTQDKGDRISETCSVGSDDSMSDYIHCRSFCPDSVSDSKLFVSFDC